MASHTISYLIEWRPAGSWVTLTTASVIDFNTDAEMSLSDNGVGFGDATTSTAQVQVLRTEVAGQPWTRTPFRITCVVDGDTARAFSGIVEKASGGAEVVTFDLIGITSDLGRRTKHLYSPAFYKRPAATKTTATSIEDPANPAYAGGLINWTWWKAGGRPYEQAGSYPTADFYYSCSQAPAAPDWSWIAGEDGYEEARRLARACGGQVFQDDSGVVTYRSPLEMVGAAAYTFSDVVGTATDSLGIYGDIAEEESGGQVAGTIMVQYTPRQARPTQQVIDDTTPRVVEKAATVAIALEPKWPLKSLQLPLTSDHITATWYDGTAAPQNGSGYGYTVDVEAQQVTLTITNNLATRPLGLWHLMLNGEPIVAGEVGTVTVGSGQPTVTLEDNVYVQSAAHANLLATMALSYYGTARKARRLTGCPYDVRRTLGETVGLTSSGLGLSNAPHVIISRRAEAGETVEYGLVDVAGLPVAADFYLIGPSYSTTHQLAW